MTSSSLPWSPRPGREIVRLAWPITVSMLSFSAMSLASTAFVAHIGVDELAGVGVASIVGVTIACFGIGLLRGAKTLVSQAVGAKRMDRFPEFIGSAVALSLALGIAAALLGRIAAPFLERISANAHAGELAAQYLSIRSLGAPIILVAAALRESSYGLGETRAPMRASLAGNLTNIALHALLILGLQWGVRGAALATIGGNAIELVLLAWPMRKQLATMRWSRQAAREIWRQGMPNGLQFVMEVGGMLLLTILVARMSAVDAAAHQLVLNLLNVSFLPAHAVGEAAAVLVGQSVGAGEDASVPRVARRALAIGCAYASLVLVIYAVFGHLIASSLAGGEAALADRAALVLYVALAFLVADAANVIARGVLRGASDVRYAAVVGIATSWLATPPLTWLLGIHFGLGVIGGWIGLAIEVFVGAWLFWRRVLRGGWRPAALAARRAMTTR